jgi:hypothetical protein
MELLVEASAMPSMADTPLAVEVDMAAVCRRISALMSCAISE